MSNTTTRSNRYSSIIEQIKTIDTGKLNDSETDDIKTEVVEEQRVYFWIRLYLNEENSNLQIGDDIKIKWTPSEETLATKFICYGKKGLDKDSGDQITEYQTEDDTRVLCLMVDERVVNYGEGIPFIRTLFKTSIHYDFQLVKRDELQFINTRNGEILEYFDVDF
jgi:hypothetical protein